MKKLFQIIAAIRKGKKLQPYAPNNSDQVSSDAEDVEDDVDDGPLTESEFESDRKNSCDNHGGDHKGNQCREVKPKKTLATTESTHGKGCKKDSTVRGSHREGGSSSSGRSKEQIEYDHLMAEIADLQSQMNLGIYHCLPLGVLKYLLFRHLFGKAHLFFKLNCELTLMTSISAKD